MALELPEPGRQTPAPRPPQVARFSRPTVGVRRNGQAPRSGILEQGRDGRREQIVLVAEVHGRDYLRTRREYVSQAEARDRGLVVLPLIGRVVGGVEQERQVAGLQVVVSDLRLH